MDVIFVDLDNTLSSMNGRYPYASEEVTEDTLNMHVFDVVTTLASAWDAKIFVLTGRSEKDRKWTMHWLNWHNVPWDRVEMRPWGDQRSDDEVKEEILDRLLRSFPDMNIRAVFDDRLSVCKMWHRRGLPLFRVGDPEASF